MDNKKTVEIKDLKKDNFIEEVEDVKPAEDKKEQEKSKEKEIKK